MNKTYNLALLIISLICFTIVSISLFGIYFVETSSNLPPSKLSVFCGIGFWLFGILGVVFQIMVSKNIKVWYKRRMVSKLRLKIERIGLFNILSNLPAIISDALLGVSIIHFIISIIVDSTSIFAYISLSVLFLSFCAHCIFNGKNYYYITNYEYIKSQLTKNGGNVNEIS